MTEENGVLPIQAPTLWTHSAALNLNELFVFSLAYAKKFVLQLELLHDGKGAVDNEHCFRHFASHLGMDGLVRGGGVSHDGPMCVRSCAGIVLGGAIYVGLVTHINMVKVGRVSEGVRGQRFQLENIRSLAAICRGTRWICLLLYIRTRTIF